MHGCVMAVAVCVASRGGCAWVRIVCSCVCFLCWCPVCGHLPVGCVVLSPCSVRSLCFSSQPVRTWAVGQAKQFFIMYIVNIILSLYFTTIGTIMSAK